MPSLFDPAFGGDIANDDTLAPEAPSPAAGSLFDPSFASDERVPPGGPEAPAVASPSIMERFGPTALRVGGQVAGAGLGLLSPLPGGTLVGGGLGAAAGEFAAQRLEESLGQREDVSAGSVAVAGAIGAVPLPALRAARPLARIAARGGQAALEGAALTTGTTLAERGELPSARQVFASAGLGAVFGAAAGGIEAKLRLPGGGKVANAAVGDVEQNLSAKVAAGTVEEPPGVPPPPGASAPRFIVPEDAPLTEPKLSTATTGAITEDAKRIAKELAQVEPEAASKRLYHRVAGALERGEIGGDDLKSVLERYDLPLEDFVSQYKDSVRGAGRQLQQLSRLKKELQAVARDNPNLASVLEDVPDVSGWARVAQAARSFDDVRRGLLTTQLATTARNVISQTGRYSVEVLDQGLTTLFGGKGVRASAGDSLEFVGSFLRAARRQDVERLAHVLDAHPLEKARFHFSPASEATLGRKAVSFLNGLNGLQESFFRRAVFDGALRTQLRASGADVMQALRSPKSIPAKFIETAVDRALHATFAAQPTRGAGKWWLDAWTATRPISTLVAPFPRFLANAAKFTFDYNPAGALRLFTANGRDQSAAVLSKASLGTVMLGLGAALRYSDYGGERWYELKVGDKRIDLRPFAPLSGFVFMGEVLKRLHEGTAGEMSVRDYAAGLLGLSRVGAFGLPVLDTLGAKNIGDARKRLETALGDYLSGFTVPLRTIKDAVSPVVDEEAVRRDTQSDSAAGRLFNDTLANIPGVSQSLPAAASVTRAAAPRQERPLLHQLGGLNISTPNVVEKELARLRIDVGEIAPKTGIAVADRKLAKRVGILAERLLPRVIASPSYAKLSDAEKAEKLVAAYGNLRKFARENFATTEPGLARQVAIKQRFTERQLAAERARRQRASASAR